jgi:hypothetical protein
MTTITADHLTRSAIVYIRQSTAYQVTNNLMIRCKISLIYKEIV